jgi:sodium transport system ATP-binding protein
MTSMASLSEKRSPLSERHTLTAIGLTKQFEEGTRPAANDISFFANAGEVLVFLGPNGAGKTTTLRMLATLLEPTMGTAIVLGHDVRREALEIRRKLGYISPDTHLHPDLTIEETLQFFGRIYGFEGLALNESVERVLRHFDLQGERDRRVGELSTGMTQRCNLARAILHDPELLVLDEPTTGLDILASSTVLAFIEDAKGRGKTILLSTHSIYEAEQLGDRIAVISQGCIRGFGTPEDLLRQTRESRLENAYLELLRQGFEL